MKFFDNMKIRNKLFFVLGILVLSMISFAVFTIIEITRISTENNELNNTYQARQINVADAIAEFNSIRFANLARGYLMETEDSVTMVSRILLDYENSSAAFLKNLTEFRDLTLFDTKLTDIEKAQRVNIVNGIIESFGEYSRIIEKLQATVETMDRNEIIRSYEETIPYGADLTEKLQSLRDLVFSISKTKSREIMDYTNRIKNLIVIITLIFVLFSTFAMFFIVSNINRPIINLEKAVLEIANGNLSHPLRSDRRDEIGSLSNCIGKMVGEISEHNKLITIMDNLDSMICVSDLEYNFLYLNKRLADMFNIDRAKVIGQKCYKATRGLDEPCSFCQLTRILPQKDTYPSADFEYVWDDVSKIWLGGTDSIIRWTDGSTVHFQAIRDVSEKKHQEELLEEALTTAKAASTAKSSFLANMSHEIRTPMNAILGITEIQLHDETLPNRTKEALDKIYHSGELLLGIINDILDLSKIEAGKLELDPLKYEAASLINDTVTLNMMRIGSKPIEFVLSVDENIPTTLIGDGLRIKQIMNNMLSNAIKYTAEGVVKLLVSAEDEKENSLTLVFRVADTGQGMSQEQVEKLFDEYSRFNMEANRTTEGTGLGMSITRNLLRLMNGEILVESAVGKGSVFTIKIPQQKNGSGVLGRELADSLEKFQVNGSKQMKRAQIVFDQMPYGKILVTDDVESNLYVATGLMAPYKISVETASSGYEAIDKIKAGKIYDIVFMDHMMPKMDGIETVKKIRELGYKEPVIALTANAVVGQSDVFMENGFDGFISKPIDIRQLNAVLKQYVRDKQPPEVLEAVQLQQHKEQQQASGKPPVIKITPHFAEVLTRDFRKAIDALETIQAKQGNYDEDDIKTYTINTHGMKSALANIGEVELSAIALQLEKAAREKNTAVMSYGLPAFTKELHKMLDKFALQIAKPEAKDSEASAEDTGFLKEKLLVIKEACGTFDKKAIKNALGELRQKTWTKATGDALAAIDENLLNGDYDEVLKTTGKMLENK